MKATLSQFATFAVFALLLTVFQNCGSSEESALSSFRPDTNQDLSERYKALETLAASDLSCSSVADCVAVPLGQKACGGPAGFLVASLLNSQFDQIDQLAAELAEAARNFNLSNQVGSTCDFIMPPNVACVQSQCVKN